jgi:hypothetical protein
MAALTFTEQQISPSHRISDAASPWAQAMNIAYPALLMRPTRKRPQ